MYALGAATAKSANYKKHIEVARDVTETCYYMYHEQSKDIIREFIKRLDYHLKKQV
jgi:hypothetical protein